jgi:microcystin-dependent protein
MSFIGEIKAFSGQFVPKGWVECNGALYATAEHPQLGSILGNRFGGDGRDTFGVPDLRCASPVGAYGEFDVGTRVGTSMHTLQILPENMPTRESQINVLNSVEITNSDHYEVKGSKGVEFETPMQLVMENANTTVEIQSASQAMKIDSYQPSIGMIYIICVEGGEYPVRG